MIKGSLVALVTPMNLDGSVNYEKLEELVEYHVANKTDGIVVIGTTGESSTLTHEEDEAVAKFVIDKVKGRIPVIVGSGSNCTEVAVRQSVRFEKMGADALLVITPYYNKTNEEGMIKHFESVADAVNIPVILYNVPSRTGCSISVKAVEKLSKHKNIKGIKEASGNMSYVAQISKYINEDFAMYSGNDDIVVPMLSMGASGVISVAANILPSQMHDMVFDFLEGRILDARDTQIKLLELINNLFIETNPIPIKEAMNYLGYNVGPNRLPLYKMSEKNADILHKSIDKLKGVEL